AAGRTTETAAGRPLTVSYCLIAQKGGAAGFRQAVEAWVGTAPLERLDQGDAMYLFAEADGRHSPVAPGDEAFGRLLGAGRLSMILTGEDAEATYAAYLVPATGAVAGRSPRRGATPAG
ncbi:MAG TPA: hypothetical protein VG939_22410, partial [Caulobacteraceae bacterium]|nr:hypothetical protein [Caulobacteraceae bacterium]